ncbi:MULTISPECIES: TetR/AcrR family transcriptional regulator [Mesorhizobium]|uniref:TetR family transcriptional regulator n=2 Tax=Mesorhizobium TaxID=68287 RepID=A0A8E3B7H4_RHILI|nr:MULTISPECIES: TetR/AcrR family transcriptional regulator [Mesorhizobium]PWJ94444.1 TetR family transcriptional regulator [Mesorhizobium loti]RUX90357.1 TetR/AcrR family transcriptional regulator [Mesorhizobium sp. M7D.F.Ca.US.004.01.2.1]
MQQETTRRSNRDRTEATRADLIAAARKLFTEKSYAETGTPEIAAAAGVTRGALYHHFADKQALFAAVVEQEAAAVAEEIERASPPSLDAREALIAGSDAYLAAMRAPGRTRLLLLDGPAVLGRPAMDAIDNRHGNRSLREGLVAAMRAQAMTRLPAEALTALLGAAFDRAALAIEAGASAQDYRTVLMALIDGLSPAPLQAPRPARTR